MLDALKPEGMWHERPASLRTPFPDFTGSPRASRSVESLTGGVGDDLLRIADGVTRIEREFEGALNLAILRDLKFGVATDRLDVRFCLPAGRALAQSR